MKRASSLTKQSSQTSKISTQTSFKQNQKYQNVKSKYKEPKKIPGATSYDPLNSSGKLSAISQNLLRIVIKLSISNFEDYINLKQVCQRFYYELDSNIHNFQYINPLQSQNIKQIVEQLKVVYFNQQINRYTTFHEKMNSMFQYGATKLNLPDKLVESLQIQVQSARVNKKQFTPQILFRKLNFASHLYFKILLDGIPMNMKSDTYDSIQVYFKIESKYLNLSKEFMKTYECQEILKKSINQKAFNYMTDGHYLFTYFENDKQMLYVLWENSTVDLMYYFWKQLKQKYFWINKGLIQKQYKSFMEQRSKQNIQNSRALSESKQKQQVDEDSDDEYISFQLQKQTTLTLPSIKSPQQQQQQQQQQQLPPKPKKKVSTFLKTKVIQNKIQYASMKDYMYDQQDFELMINIHTGIKGQNLFYFVDTKAMPKLDEDCLYFTYKMKEHINLSYKFYLDNKLGMKEAVENLFLCDITFKDRDDFRILFSGFVQMFNEDTTSVAKQYDVSYMDIKEWRSLKLWNENRFELVILFGTQPSVIKLLELKLIDIN